MSIAALPAPLSAERNGLPVLVLALTDEHEALVVDDGGLLGNVPISELIVNWRYDWRAHVWLDVGEVDGKEDDGPDGGPDVQGPVSEPDGVSQGDPLDQEGEQTPGDPGRLDAREGDQ